MVYPALAFPEHAKHPVQANLADNENDTVKDNENESDNVPRTKFRGGDQSSDEIAATPSPSPFAPSEIWEGCGAPSPYA
ncbi:MAG: hypothetical protein IK130_06010 [Oscillospiraceae bacterium]|nr:hypothetical protein [Oscillospiraceae bacterium]